MQSSFHSWNMNINYQWATTLNNFEYVYYYYYYYYIQFVFCIVLLRGRDQTMVLRLNSSALFQVGDRALLRICDVPRKTIFWMSSMLIFPRIFDTSSFIRFVSSPRAPIMTGITVVFICHILVTSISRSLYFDNFSVSLLATFRSDGTDMSMKMHFFSFLSLITISGLFAVTSLLVWIGISNNITTSFPSTTVLGNSKFKT